MKKPIAALMCLLMLFACRALADHGEAEVTFNGTKYHFVYRGSEITDGELVVRMHCGESVPVIGGIPKTPAIAVAEIAGERVLPYKVHVSIGDGQSDYACTFKMGTVPDAVWVYPDGRESGSALLWRAGDPEPAAAETPAPFPEELAGTWAGTGIPKNGGPSIGLSLVLFRDGSGIYRFTQEDYTESCDFSLGHTDSSFTVRVPEGNPMGIAGCEGTWALEDEKLILDITTSFVRGGTFSYRAECERVTAPEYETMLFGSYDQDGVPENGAEPIEWLVVDREGDSALLVSRFALDTKPFHEGSSPAAWDASELRGWLNGPFLEASFTEEERARIEARTVPAEPNPDHPTDPGADTRDSVFLLSYREAMRFFPSAESRIAEATRTAVRNGTYARETDGVRRCMWWLRTPGDTPGFILIVLSGGILESDGGLQGYTGVGVRPAIRIRVP